MSAPTPLGGRKPSLLVLCALVSCSAAMPLRATGQSTGLPEGGGRPVTVDDLMRVEDVRGGAALSPDGRQLAYVVIRGQLDNHGIGSLGGALASDVWLAAVDGGSPVNLTRGTADRTSSRGPVWSPDGKRLALLSTRGPGPGYKVWIWDTRTRRRSRAGDGQVDGIPHQPNLDWISNTEVLYAAVPPSRSPEAGWGPRLLGDTRALFNDRQSGSKVTARVLESRGGPDAAGFRFRGSQYPLESRLGGMVLLDVVRANDRLLSGRLMWRRAVSPDRRRVALLGLRQSPGAARTDEPIIVESQARLVVMDRNGEVSRSAGTGADSVAWSSPVAWSPGGTRIAFAEAEGSGAPASLAIMDVTPGRVTQPDLRGLNVPIVKRLAAVARQPTFQFSWVSDTSLIVLASRSDTVFRDSRGGLTSTRAGGRLDWWLVGLTGRQENLTAGLALVPDQVEVVDGTALWVSDGRLWRRDPKAGAVRQFGIGVSGTVVSIAATAPGMFGVVVRSPAGASRLLMVSLATGKSVEVPWPGDDVELGQVWPDRGTALFHSGASGTGSRLWVSRVGAVPRLLHETNTFLRDLAVGRLESFDYTGGDGQALVGWVLLPPGYRPGMRVPLVTAVHGGQTYTRTNRPEVGVGELWLAGHPQILTGKGYAVLFPSMPLPPIGVVADPLLAHAGSVLPAVDSVVARGIADPERLGVSGTSYGGYAVYGLITQTDRFKVAIACDGFTDLRNFWGMFEGQFHFSATAHRSSHHANLMEVGQGRMMSAPWEDPSRYARNSPITYVDRVQTPLLMIHGEWDHVPMTDVEVYFTALYRQGKRARFLRYMAESCHGHCDSPANSRHLTANVLGWLDEHLDVARDSTGAMLFAGGRARSRNGSPPLEAEAYLRFDGRTSF